MRKTESYRIRRAGTPGDMRMDGPYVCNRCHEAPGVTTRDVTRGRTTRVLLLCEACAAQPTETMTITVTGPAEELERAMDLIEDGVRLAVQELPEPVRVTLDKPRT